eukprot:g1894.t1
MNSKEVKWQQKDQRRWRFSARGGRWEEALVELDGSHVQLEAADFQIVIHSCLTAGAGSQALDLLLQMGRVRLEPDAPCFGTVIHAVEQLPVDRAQQAEASRACQRLDVAEGLDFLAQALQEHVALSEASYVHGINLCRRHEQWEMSLSVLQQVDARFSGADAKMLGEARRACLEAGQWRKVLELSERRSGSAMPDAYGYAVQMIALERLGELAKAYELFKEMIERNIAPNEHVLGDQGTGTSRTSMCISQSTPWLRYAALMGDGSDDHGWLRALQLLEDSRLRQVAVNDVMYGKAIACCASAKEWTTALELLRRMKEECGVSMLALSSALCACGEGLEWQRALQLLHAAPALKVEPDVELWNYAICACGLSAQGGMARKLLTSMKKKKLPPSVECYNSALGALRQDPLKVEVVERLLNVMQKEQLQPNTVTMNAALGLFVEKGQWQQALAFGERMSKKQVMASQVTYGELIGSCKDSRQWTVALSLLEASLAEGSCSVITYNIAMSVCECDVAIRLLRKMPELGLQPDVFSYNAVLSACQDAEQWELALKIFQDEHRTNRTPGLSWSAGGEMKEASIVPDVYTYGAVILSCSLALQWEWAVNLWHEMESKGVPANAMIMSSVVGACHRSEQQNWVDYLIGEMKRRGFSLENTAFQGSVGGTTLAGSMEDRTGACAGHAGSSTSAESAPKKLSGESLKVFMQKVEGASKLYAEALKDGAFAPWRRPGRLLDLHGMSSEVAKVAVYMALKAIPDLAEDDLAFLWGLKLIVGKGNHSKDNEVVLEPVIRQLLEEVFRLRITKTVEGCFRVLAEDGARLSTVGVGARCGASMHHAHKCVQAQKEKEKWLFTVLDFDQFDNRVFREDLWAIRQEGLWPPEWLKEGQEPPKAWIRRKEGSCY